jgi:phosphoribosylanthranilate isomerase
MELSVLLKYCGNRSLEDVIVSARSAANYVGFIFAKSKRQVQADEVKQWLKAVRLKDKKLVGVFVNAPISQIEAIIKEVPLSIIQCHGTETETQIYAIKERTRVPVWKVIHHSNSAVQKMKAFSGIADGYVIDTKVEGAWGGTGISFNWSYVPAYVEEAEKQGVKCFIAGGVRSENIEELLRFKPHGIDISSGIEENERKSSKKIERLEQKVREYEKHS